MTPKWNESPALAGTKLTGTLGVSIFKAVVDEREDRIVKMEYVRELALPVLFRRPQSGNQGSALVSPKIWFESKPASL